MGRHHSRQRRGKVHRLWRRLEVARLQLGDDQLALDQAEQTVGRLVGLLEEGPPSQRVDGVVPLHDPGERVLHRGRGAAHLVADRAQHQVFRLERLALHGHVLVQGEHACRLAFDHPLSGARVDVRSPLPDDLQRALSRAERLS